MIHRPSVSARSETKMEACRTEWFIVVLMLAISASVMLWMASTVLNPPPVFC